MAGHPSWQPASSRNLRKFRQVAANRSSPTLAIERSLVATGVSYIIGMDEVGRGALAGPVSVGAVMIHAAGISASPPTGLA
ncbi:MAG: hypothetical protein FJW32_29715, partial [Acidobacteria bacterium]|nr:hypothetical protein [Acidobacteriota bacterium]